MTKNEIESKMANIFDINTIDGVENVTKFLNLFFLIGINVFKGMNNKNDSSISNFDVTYLTLSGTWWGVITAYFISRGLKRAHSNAMVTSYNEILKRFNELAHELEMKDPTELYLLYTYMYSRGYLSYNKSFSFGSTPDIISRMGSSVINGQGVCRHISSLFTDILNYDQNNGIKAATIGVYAYDNDEDCDNSELVSKSIDGNIFLKPIYKTVGNHAITVCEYQGKIYAFDPTNETNLKVIDEKNIVFRGSGLDCKYLNTIINYLQKSSREMIKILKNRNFYILSEDDLKMLDKFADIVENKKDVFEKFYEDNNDIYKDIARRYSRYRK